MLSIQDRSLRSCPRAQWPASFAAAGAAVWSDGGRHHELLVLVEPFEDADGFTTEYRRVPPLRLLPADEGGLLKVH